MASATRVQMWTYSILLLLDTLLATLLGTTVAEATSKESESKDESEWADSGGGDQHLRGKPSIAYIHARQIQPTIPPRRRLLI